MAELKRLAKAARKGDVDAVVSFVEGKWQGDADRTINKSGDTLLLLAARHRQPDVVRVLLDRKQYDVMTFDVMLCNCPPIRTWLT